MGKNSKKCISTVILGAMIFSMSTGCIVNLPNIPQGSNPLGSNTSEVSKMENSEYKEIESSIFDENSKPDIESSIESVVSEISEEQTSNKVIGDGFTKDTPVPINTYVTYNITNFDDKSKHSAKVKLVKVTTESQDSAYVNGIINEYNSKHTMSKIDKSDIEDYAEFVIAEFETVAPTDGYVPYASSLSPDFTVDLVSTTVNGQDIFYSNLFEVKIDESKTDNKINAGETLHSKLVFTMVKGYTDYTISIMSHEDEHMQKFMAVK